MFTPIENTQAIAPHKPLAAPVDRGLWYLKSAFKALVIADPRFQATCTHPGWAVKQAYANSCIAAVFTEEVRLRTPGIVSRIILGEVIQDTLAQRIAHLTATQSPAWQAIAWPNGPTYSTLAPLRLQQVQSLHTNLLKTFNNTPSTFPIARPLHTQWAYWFQTLLSLAHLAEPNWEANPTAFITINTPFLFGQAWRISLLSTTLLQPLRYLFSKEPPPRLKKDRYDKGYISYPGCLALLSPHIALSAPVEDAQHHLALNPKTAPLLLKDKAFTHTLWLALHKAGGARAEAAGHAYYLQALETDDAPHFLLYDPLKKHPLILNSTALLKRLSQNPWDIFVDHPWTSQYTSR